MPRSTPARLAIAALSLILWSAGCHAPRPAAVAPSPVPDDRSRPRSPVANDLVAAHNAERGRRKLPPLVLNRRLQAAATGHARDMAGRRRMSHKGGDGSTSFDRIKRSGYAFRAAGENVAYGFDDVAGVMSGWMHSPGHKRNILGDYTEIGVGRATASDGASYWCVTFGTPASP